MTDDLRTQLQHELEPTTEAITRMQARLALELAGGAAATSDQTAARGRGRRRLPTIRLGVALAGAAAVAAVVALSPFDASNDASVVPAPATARAALERAADSAGAAPWAPLGSDEYHHTMTTTFNPVVPVAKGDTRKKIDQLMTIGGPRADESWTNRAGHGLSLDVTGGNGDPDLYPVVSNDGWGMQPTYGRDYPNIAPVDIEQGLRYADLVRVNRSLPGERAVDSMWYRTPSGFVRKTHRVGKAMFEPSVASSYGAFVQQQHWEATIAQLDAVNGASKADRAAAVQRLLDEDSTFFGNPGVLGTPGSMGVTKATQDEDRRIVRAIELLGSAPLRPSVRRELFDWLAHRPIAKLEGTDTDALGREGTRVTFERIFDKTVPAKVVTKDALLDQAEREFGVRPAGDVPGGASIRVPADHQFRRTYVTILFDTSSGELLDYVLYGRIETTAQQPRLQPANGWFPRPGSSRPVTWRLTKAVQRQGVSDALLYVIRERTTSISNPQTAACATTPRMCR